MAHSKILIADDNRDMIYLIKREFEGEGFDFVEAHDGDEALVLIMDTKPDIILLDLKMPRKNGLEVLREMKKMGEVKDIPVIVLTVVSDTREKILALENGASDFLLKPPIPAELKARVNTQLKLRAATKALKKYSRQLEEVVDEKTRELREYTAKLEDMVEEKVGVIRRQHENHLENIKSAQKIQRSLLPASMPIFEDIDFFTRYIPCESIGGDFYDIFRIDENTLGMFVADVSGHGVPSAMITIFLKQEVSYHAKMVKKGGRHSVASPQEVLKDLNKSFFRNNISEGTYFVTIAYCTYAAKRKELLCSLAGHHALPLIRRKSGKIEFIEMSGFPIGWFENIEDFQERRYELEKGDKFILYTDGIFDLLMDRKTPDYDGRALETVLELFREKDIEGRFDGMVQEYMKKHSKFEDDITLFIMNLH